MGGARTVLRMTLNVTCEREGGQEGKIWGRVEERLLCLYIVVIVCNLSLVFCLL